MSTTLAIAERELRSIFTSTIAWVLMAAFMAITGILFTAILFNANVASLQYLFSNISVVFLFVAPFLTMRLIAEENRMGTVELLLTNPVRDFEVVLGKFLGVMGVILAMLGLTLYYPLLLFVFGTPDPGPIISGYLGATLSAAALASIGLLFSSMTENQMVAAFVAFATNLALWLSDALSGFVGKPLGDVMKYLSITGHAQDFSRGVIDSSHVIFFLSVVAAALFLTYLSLQSRRWRA